MQLYALDLYSLIDDYHDNTYFIDPTFPSKQYSNPSSFAQLSCIFLYQKLSTYPSNMVFIRHRNLFFTPSAKDLINMHYQSPRIEDIHTCDSLDNCYCLNQYHPAQITSTQHLRKCIHIHSPSSITWVPSRQKIQFFFSLKPMYKGSSMSLQLRQEGSLKKKKKGTIQHGKFKYLLICHKVKVKLCNKFGHTSLWQIKCLKQFLQVFQYTSHIVNTHE